MTESAVAAAGAKASGTRMSKTGGRIGYTAGSICPGPVVFMPPTARTEPRRPSRIWRSLNLSDQGICNVNWLRMRGNYSIRAEDIHISGDIYQFALASSLVQGRLF